MTMLHEGGTTDLAASSEAHFSRPAVRANTRGPNNIFRVAKQGRVTGVRICITGGKLETDSLF